jgi:hypothetical protein
MFGRPTHRVEGRQALKKGREHVSTTRVELVGPRGRLPRNEQPVTNEGGLIRFALGARNDREVRAK